MNGPLPWMAPGLRLSYRADIAVMKRGGGLSDTGGSGTGIQQMDLVAVEQDSVALLSTYFMTMNGATTREPLSAHLKNPEYRFLA